MTLPEKLTAEPSVHRIELAARQAHGVQKDRDGSLHIEHVRRVAATVPTEYQRIAWLHDVLEDTQMTVTDLRALGLPDSEVTVIRLLTRPTDGATSYADYIATLTDCDCNLHLAALAVKEADLLDNLARCIRQGDGAADRYRKALRDIYMATV